jgi:hypothetical protein
MATTRYRDDQTRTADLRSRAEAERDSGQVVRVIGIIMELPGLD